MLRGSAGGHSLHSLAVSLLLAGLPVTLWWHGPIDFDDHVFRRLAQVADRVILDSRTWPEPLAVLPRLRQAIDVWEPKLRFSDLQWVDLTDWRRLIARAFDIPAARAALPRLTEVVIEYGRTPRLSVSAVLLAGWLAGRLGWQIGDQAPVRDETGYVLPLRRSSDADGQLLLALRHGETEERIRAIELRADGAEPMRCACEITNDGAYVETRIELPRRAPLVHLASMHPRETARLLGEELSLTGRDPVYAASLSAAVELTSAIQRPTE